MSRHFGALVVPGFQGIHDVETLSPEERMLLFNITDQDVMVRIALGPQGHEVIDAFRLKPHLLEGRDFTGATVVFPGCRVFSYARGTACARELQDGTIRIAAEGETPLTITMTPVDKTGNKVGEPRVKVAKLRLDPRWAAKGGK